MTEYTPTTDQIRDSVTIRGWDEPDAFEGEKGWQAQARRAEDFDRWLAARDEAKFLEGARWALRALQITNVDRTIENIREAQKIEANDA